MRLFITCILFLSFQSIFAQHKDTISTEVYNFWNIVNEGVKFDEKNHVGSKQYSNTEIKDIAKKLYNATDKDPFGFARYITDEHKKYLENAQLAPNLIAPYPKLHILIGNINKVYGSKFGEILETPFFIRGKFLKQIDTFYYSEREKDKFKQTKLIVQIEEVIKGKRFYKQKDIVEINFLDWWVDYPIHLKKDSSYFMAIRLWGDYSDDLCLENYSPNDLEIYPIRNGIVEIRKNAYGKNTFGLGEKIEWKKFLSSFKEKYILEEGIK